MSKAAKVTDPRKIVTDVVMLRELLRQGIDKDYVEFWKDYGSRNQGRSPYAKFYRDLKSNKQFVIMSGLPMVNADGVRVEVGWERIGAIYHSKPNQFIAQVDGKQALLRCINDQPTGIKKGDQVVWEPELFLDDVEQTCGEAILLPTDPTNENYHSNVIEWDYGTACKRRIRIIEGRFRERWLLESNPHSKVRIKHNFTGNLQLRLGYATDAEGNPLKVSVIDDEEIIEASEFDKAAFPVEIGASGTFYPSPGEVSPVDGYAADGTDTASWTTKVGHPGTTCDPVGDCCYMYLGTISTPNWWDILYRPIILFDISSITGTVTVVTLSTYGFTKSDGLSATPDLNVYESAPASNNTIVAGDYDSLGTTPFCDTPITYGNFNIGDPGVSNDWTFNVVGNSFVQTAIDGDGIVKLGLRNANYDVAEELDPGSHTPPWVSATGSALHSWASDKGSGYKPKLVVTYTPYQYYITGVTRDAEGAILGSCTVWLFRTSDKAYLNVTTSDSVTGVYSFTVGSLVTEHFIKAHKDGTPNVFGTTERDLKGVE